MGRWRGDRIMNKIEKELKEKNFREYKPSPLDAASVDKCWQKRYDDEQGNKRYFLDVKHYELRHPTLDTDLSGYEVSTQLYMKGSHNAFNIDFLDGITITEAEQFINELFENMGIKLLRIKVKEDYEEEIKQIKQEIIEIMATSEY